jgi:hypothetical protein
MRERVRIEGRGEVFLVVWVDLAQNAADLIPLTDGNVLEEGVSFTVIQPLDESSAATAD